MDKSEGGGSPRMKEASPLDGLASAAFEGTPQALVVPQGRVRRK